MLLHLIEAECGLCGREWGRRARGLGRTSQSLKRYMEKRKVSDPGDTLMFVQRQRAVLNSVRVSVEWELAESAGGMHS